MLIVKEKNSVGPPADFSIIIATQLWSNGYCLILLLVSMILIVIWQDLAAQQQYRFIFCSFGGVAWNIVIDSFYIINVDIASEKIKIIDLHLNLPGIVGSLPGRRHMLGSGCDRNNLPLHSRFQGFRTGGPLVRLRCTIFSQCNVLYTPTISQCMHFSTSIFTVS